MNISQEHEFRLLQTPYSTVEPVSWSVIALENESHSQNKSKLGGYIRKAVTARWGKLCYRLKMLSDDIFSFWLVVARDLQG